MYKIWKALMVNQVPLPATKNKSWHYWQQSFGGPEEVVSILHITKSLPGYDSETKEFNA